MESISPWIPVLIVAAVLGGLVSCLALPPVVRHSLGGNRTNRNLAIVGFALLAFLVALPGWIYLSAAANFNYNSSREFMDAATLESLRKNSFAVINEIWLRQMIPIQWSQNCYSGDPVICDLADHFHATPGDTWLGLLQGGVASLICGAIVSWLVRDKNESRV